MLGRYQRPSRHRVLWARILLASLSLVLVTNSTTAQQNITLDDTDLYILYAPATSWHASTVECDSCLLPSSSSAHGGTWHDGTHIVPAIDGDDGNAVGNSGGDGTPTSGASSAKAAQTSAAIVDVHNPGDDDDDDSDHGKGINGKGGGTGNRLTRTSPTVKGRPLPRRISIIKREGNPFQVQGDDSDDPGVQDVPVTATLNFTGEAVYVFAILPLFPAPTNTTPTFTNLSFFLDGRPHGTFMYRPDSTKSGTPTVDSPVSDKYRPNVGVFSAAGLENMDHSLVVNVGVDSVFLLDYVTYTTASNSSSGSNISAAENSQSTAGAVIPSSTNKHNVATFAGAVGGSFGLLSALALGLCISIRCRRQRARLRERRVQSAFAETFTAHDHGEIGPDDDEGSAFGRQRVNGNPVMAQVASVPFIPRYFPGSLPASPPPYVAEENVPSITTPLMTMSVTASVNRSGISVAVPCTLPPPISLPTATFDLHRTISNNSSQSYADRPPPTPPIGTETHIAFFGPDGIMEQRSLYGGIIGPLPADAPLSEENAPMLSMGMQDDGGEQERHQDREDRRSQSIGSCTFGSTRSSHSSGSRENVEGTSSTYIPHSESSATSVSESPITTHRNDDDAAPSPYQIPSTCTSPYPVPSASHPVSTSLSVAPKPLSPVSANTLAYPLLQPSRIPLPPSLYGSDIGSQESLPRGGAHT